MVCLGNICRSPLAEGILREKINKYNINATTDSAGTIGMHSGEAPDNRSILVAKKHNIDISDLRSRKFSIKDFDYFDKIYVMDLNNKQDVISLSRNNNDKLKVEMIMNLVYPNKNIDIPDPYYGGENGFEDVFQMLDIATDKIIEILKKNS